MSDPYGLSVAEQRAEADRLAASGWPAEEIARVLGDPPPHPTNGAGPDRARPNTNGTRRTDTAPDGRGLEDLVDDIDIDGAAVLTEVRTFLARFVVFPSEDALTAATLWVVHTHAIDASESTTRIAHLSPEPASGKTRALEVYDLLVPYPMHAVNATPAALFRSVKDLAHRPTILFDEIDTVFGPRAKENEEIRGLLNAGHRRGAVAYRCVGEGTRQKVEPFPAYAAVALAGLGDLPDTIMTRSIVIRMRRRAPGEHVESFRRRLHAKQGHALRDRLAGWAVRVADKKLAGAWPRLPEGITDRPADVWEPLLAIAEAAGGEWPARARAACLALVSEAQTVDSGSLGVRLLADLRSVFAITDDDGRPTGDLHAVLPTETILTSLRGIEDGPWRELGKLAKPLDAGGLARRLKPYGAAPHQYRAKPTKQRGYSVAGDDKGRGGLADAWSRYLPVSPSQNPGTPGTAGTGEKNTWSDLVAAVPGDRARPGTDPAEAVPGESGCTGCTGSDLRAGTENGALTSDVPAVPAVPGPWQRERETADDSTTCRWRVGALAPSDAAEDDSVDPLPRPDPAAPELFRECATCGQRLLLNTPDRSLCARCDPTGQTYRCPDPTGAA